ncbi:MAG: DUF4837 family protein [Calditrichaeota bacterium]|nr:DUF4837 family protein [Calditrichota bacterium]RQV99586.1 MAG: DUF4837 family protein [Calditrichota bacterium]
MMKKIHILNLFVLFVVMIFSGWDCKTKINALGEDDVIYVFADSSDRIEYEEPLNSIFGQFIQTPIMEREFLLRWKPFENFEEYKNYKNIFIMGRLNSKDPVSQNVRGLLKEEVIEGVEDGRFFYIPKEDVWASNQYVMIMVANTVDDMIQKIYDLGDLAYDNFTQYYYKRLREQMFRHMEQKELQSYIERHFPFTMRIQHDYFIANENIEENFVWIRRVQPDRSILVHWLPLSEGFRLNSRWIIDERNRLAEKIYSGDVIVEEETRAFVTQFKRWNAIRLEGTWRNDSLVIGGPFRNITFVDSATNRIYMVDYYVQAVGERKIPFLHQLKVIIYSFDTLQNPRKEEQPA